MHEQHHSSRLFVVRQGTMANEDTTCSNGVEFIYFMLNATGIFYLTRDSLCELRWKDANKEVVVFFMAYESGK